MRSSLFLSVMAVSGCAMFWEVPATPLHAAAWRGDVAAIRQLVKDGADVNASDDLGGTALYWAARGGHPIGLHQCQGEAASRPEVIATLIELGANPNTRDRRPKGFGRSSGWTPLLVALHHEQFKSAAVLLEMGADPNIRSDQGMSAMDMATVEGAPQALLALMVAKGFKAQASARLFRRDRGNPVFIPNMGIDVNGAGQPAFP